MDHVSDLISDQEHQLSPHEIEAAGQVQFDFSGAASAPAPRRTDTLAIGALIEAGSYTVTGDAAEGPVRQPFGEWLLGQTANKGWVGDLAKAAKNEPGFPKRGDPEDVRKRLKDMVAGGDVYEALDDAELDWLAL